MKNEELRMKNGLRCQSVAIFLFILFGQYPNGYCTVNSSFLILNLKSYGFTERSKNQNKFGKEYPKNHFSNEDGGFCQTT